MKTEQNLDDGAVITIFAALMGILKTSPGPHYFNLFSSLNSTLKKQPFSPEDWLSFIDALEAKKKQLKKEGGLQQEILNLIRHLVNQEKLFQFDASKSFFWDQGETHNSRRLEQLRTELTKVKSLQERWKIEKITSPLLSNINQWIVAALNLLGREDISASVEYFHNLLQKAKTDSKLILLLSDFL